jgi:hypothetical protein
MPIPESDPRSRIERLRRWSYLLDEAYRVPGTRIRFGWDPIIGLIPWAGDILTGLFSLAIVTQAFRAGLPGVIKLRMLANILIDLIVGSVPFVGDLFDFAWQSNRKNMELLDRHAFTSAHPRAGDWLFVTAAVIIAAAGIALPLLVAWFLVHQLQGWLPASPLRTL